MVNLFPSQLGIALLAATGLIAGSAAAQAPNDQLVVFQTDRTTTVYQCKNGMVVDVTFMSIDDLPLIKLSHPSTRSGDGKRHLLLPQSQSGSGIRYATDFVSVHMKGDELVLASTESAITDEIAPVSCSKN